MRTLWITAALSAALLVPMAPAFAKESRSQLMTSSEMMVAARGVKNAETRPRLEHWVNVCLQKKWGSCQVAWWDLIDKGNLVQIENDGFSTWGFLKQDDANEVLMHMVFALDNPSYRSYWDIEITPSKNKDGLPNIMDGRQALTNGAEHRSALSILEERFASRGVAYKVLEEMPTRQLEWLRTLALMFTIRDDTTSAYQVLTELHSRAANTPEAMELYNKTLQAVKSYSSQGVKK